MRLQNYTPTVACLECQPVGEEPHAGSDGVLMQMPSTELKQIRRRFETVGSAVVLAVAHGREALSLFELVMLHAEVPHDLADEPVRFLADVKPTRRVGPYAFWNQPECPAYPRFLVLRSDRSRPLFGAVAIGGYTSLHCLV